MMHHIYKEPQFGENWFNYSRFYSEMLSKLRDGSHIVEVGSWKGKSAAYMAVNIINSGKNIKFDCADIWEDHLYDIFLSNIESIKHIINPVRMSSAKASELYQDNSLDFVFIDANHDYEYVKQDIELWLPKLKKNNGSVLAGHDYSYDSWPGVKQAVDEIFKNKKNILKKQQCWIVNIE